MRFRSFAWLLAALLIAGTTFVLVPPFPRPAAFLASDYSALQRRLGPPAVIFGDKFVGWARTRWVATWTLEVRLDFPLEPGSRAHSVSRCLWIQWAGSCLRRAREG